MEEKREIPIVAINTMDGNLELHWYNTRIRTFADPQYDHVEYFNEQNMAVGIKATRAIMDALFELDFPMQFDPLVDESTFEWFVRNEVRVLERELDEL